MDDRFVPAQEAIGSDSTEELERLIRADPRLATDSSLAPDDHPTLLCCLVLEMPARRSLSQLIRLFSEFGAELNRPLVAAASIGNIVGLETLLELGAPIAGKGTWSALEEALYWGQSSIVDWLIQRGAPVNNLRKYAALGDLAGVKSCFDGVGRLTSIAGEVAWPFRATIPDDVRHDRRQVINNALVFAAVWGQTETASELVIHGAEVNAMPAGFDFAATALHYAALNNRREMVDWLLDRGADPTIRDTKVQNTPDEWAEYSNHFYLADHLRRFSGHRAR